MDKAPKTQYYTPPIEHADDIRKMVIFLGVFFGSLTLLVISIVIYANELARQLPFSVEQRFVRPYEAMAEYVFDDERSPESLEIESYLQSLADALAVQMSLPEDFVVKVHYLDTNSINAFATLGGHVFVFRGLIERMPDENSLAMVLAHELSHVKSRDALAATGRGLALQMLYGFVSGDYQIGTDIIVDSSEIGVLYFSREQEQAADAEALNALHRHYGHVEGYDTLFALLKEKYADDQGESTFDENWLSTHPDVSARIDSLGRYADVQGWARTGVLEAIPESVRESL